jgi:hypothetical protein
VWEKLHNLRARGSLDDDDLVRFACGALDATLPMWWFGLSFDATSPDRFLIKPSEKGGASWQRIVGDTLHEPPRPLEDAGTLREVVKHSRGFKIPRGIVPPKLGPPPPPDQPSSSGTQPPRPPPLPPPAEDPPASATPPPPDPADGSAAPGSGRRIRQRYAAAPGVPVIPRPPSGRTWRILSARPHHQFSVALILDRYWCETGEALAKFVLDPP